MNTRDQLIAALLGASKAQQPSAPAHSRLARVMAGAPRAKPGDAKYASLAALPPYGESKFADSFGAQGTNSQGAFQSDAYQDPGYQVF